jgi:hypothetical protein
MTSTEAKRALRDHGSQRAAARAAGMPLFAFRKVLGEQTVQTATLSERALLRAVSHATRIVSGQPVGPLTHTVAAAIGVKERGTRDRLRRAREAGYLVASGDPKNVRHVLTPLGRKMARLPVDPPSLTPAESESST